MNISDYTPFREKALLCHTGLSCAYEANIRNEVNEDFILPDSLPDVKKLLSIEFTPHVTDYSCENGMLRYSGETVCDLLYVSDTNRLRAATVTSHFSGKESIGAGEDQRVLILPRVNRNDSRMLSPRKLSIRIGLELGVCVFGGHELKCSVMIGEREGEEPTLRQLTDEITTLVFTPTERMGLALREDLELENHQPTIGEVICCRMTGTITQITVGDGKADLTGDVLVRCLYETDTGKCYELNKHYPVHETLEIPDARTGMSAIGILHICGIQVSAQNNSYGEKRILELDAEIDATVWCFDNERAQIVRDAYSTAYEIETQTTAPQICRFDSILGTSFSVNFSIPREEIGGERANGVFGGTVLPGELSLIYDSEKKKYMVDGRAIVTFLSEANREEEGYSREYLTLRTEAPIHGEIEYRGETEDSTLRPILHQPKILQTRFRADDGKLYADFEVGFQIPLLRTSEVSCLSQITVDQRSPHVKTDASMLLYYPTSSDTLWSVSKQYHIMSQALALANQIGEEIPEGTKVLLVPLKNGI